MTKEFTTKELLTITTGKLLCDIESVYNIIDFMYNISIFTHQIPDLAPIVKAEVIKQHPELNIYVANLEHLDYLLTGIESKDKQEVVDKWVDDIIEAYELKESYIISSIKEY